MCTAGVVSWDCLYQHRAFEEKPQASHGTRTSLACDKHKWAGKGLFLLLPFREAFPGFSVPEGDTTQYSFGGKHVNRCNSKHFFSQALNFPWHTLLHSCKISYESVEEIPVLYDQRQNSHPLQQGWSFTQSLIPSCLFLSGGGSFH